MAKRSMSESRKSRRSFLIQMAVRYAMALLITAAALALRELLNPVLGDLGPFLSIYAAVTFASVYLGAGPATLISRSRSRRQHAFLSKPL